MGRSRLPRTLSNLALTPFFALTRQNPLFSAPRRRRRRVGIATLIGGAIAAVLLKWVGLSPPLKPAPQTPAPSAKTVPQNGSVPPNAGVSSKGVFSFYTLALSLAPAFCETAPTRKQCSKLTSSSNAITPLTLHGLWPENAQPGRYPACDAPITTRKALERDIDPRRLRLFMPGAADGLVSHEWQKHGSCTGLSAKAYFMHAIDWTERVNAALASVFAQSAGKQMSAVGVKSGANTVMPGLGDAITLHCRNIKTADANARGKPVLMELHVCLQKGGDGAPNALLECAAMDRIDQGCGANFIVDGV
jgi:ribonuclease T2